MILKINFDSEEALYMQLCNQIIVGIATDMLHEGDNLPSVRQLAEDIGKKLSEKYISEKNTKDTEFSGQISKVHVTSDLIPLEERW